MPLDRNAPLPINGARPDPVTDDVFSAAMDERAPNRLKEPEPLPAYSANSTLLGSEGIPAPAELLEAPAVVAPEDGLVPEPAPEPVAPVDPKYAGKSTDEIIEMHRNLESRLGAQGQELGELRAIRSELDQMKGALAERDVQHAPLTQETVDWVEESVMGNPLETLRWVEQNQPALKERALATWGAIDPVAAGRYETQKLIEENDRKWEARLASVEAPFRATQNDSQLERAYYAVSTTLPGFTDVVEDLPALLEANPEYKAALVSGDQAQKQRTLENLGKLALFEKAMAQPVDVAPVPVTHVVDPRVTASVASGSSTGEHGGETPTQADKLKASMLAVDATNLHAELARNRAK